MQSKKCCFVIDRDFIDFHHGCRHYLFGMSKIFSILGYESRFLIPSGSEFQIVKFSDDAVRNNGYCKNTCVGLSREEILNRLSKDSKIVYSVPNKVNTSGIVKSRENKDQHYDLCVVGGPWVFEEANNLPKADKYFCVAHDIVPNRNYFAEPNDFGLLMFAYKHAKGYKYFSTYADGLITTTPTVAEQLAEYGFSKKNHIFTMPMFLPVGYEEDFEIPYQQRKGVVLAAPFDVRKGMDDIPTILNAANVNKLSIFGRPRCDCVKLIEWFERIETTDVEWWIDIDLQKQRELYARAKVLLFPSYQEGLGLPILEATACGTSVLVRNRKPMNLLVPNQRNIANDNLEFVTKLKYFLREDVDLTSINLKYAKQYKVDNINLPWLRDCKVNK